MPAGLDRLRSPATRASTGSSCATPTRRGTSRPSAVARLDVVPGAGGWLGDFDAGAAARARSTRLRRQLDGIAALGGVGVITPAAWGMFTRRLPPFDEPPRTPAEDREVLVEGLAELGEHARPRRGAPARAAQPLRGPHGQHRRAGRRADRRRRLARPSRILADTYHMNIEEDDPCAALAAAGDLLGAVHLSDSNRAPAGHRPRPVRARSSPRCARIGFDGVLSVECRLRGEPAEAVRECGGFLRLPSCL